MSLVDFIKDNPIIGLSVGLALLPLLVAVLVVLHKKLKALSRARAANRQSQGEAIVAALVENANEALDAPLLLDEDADAEDALADDVEAEAIAEELQEEVAANEAQNEPETDSAIQSLLTDVFMDDGSDERYRALVGDAQPIAASDLAAFAEQVAQELGVRQ